MTRHLALVALVALTACSREQRGEDSGVRVVKGARGEAPTNAAAAKSKPVSGTAVPAASSATPPVSPPSPEVPHPRRDFVDPALPPELMQDGGLAPLPPRPPMDGGGR